ncbi:MAG: ZIP family metal transporter [Candidatus Hodarchaeota archaeon]
MIILWIIGFCLIGSVGAIITASIFLLIQERKQKIIIPCLLSYASGTLITTALLGLIPHAFEYSNPTTILFTILLGIIFFFLLEKLIIWRHCHETECEMHGTVGTMIIIGDAFHNAIDGATIAVGFLISIPVGIITTISVIAHEIPQEAGDFAILIHDKYSKRKALILNTVSSLTTVPTAILTYYTLDIVNVAIPYIMGISAASFLYIALTDLYPELHKSSGFWVEFGQFFMMTLGIGTILLILQFH